MVWSQYRHTGIFILEIFCNSISFDVLFSIPDNVEERINSLFGVKLNDDISNYADVENGKLAKGFSETIYNFGDEFLTIDRDENF